VLKLYKQNNRFSKFVNFDVRDSDLSWPSASIQLFRLFEVGSYLLVWATRLASSLPSLYSYYWD
jgi:hypothetical protein